MISIKKLRENKDSYQNGLKLKGDSTDLDTIITLDIKVRSIKRKSNEMRAERNNASEAIGNAKKAGEDASKAILNTRELGEKLKELELELHDLESQLNTLLFQVPNLPHHSVPIGSNENENIEVRIWGEKSEFTFQPKTHMELGIELKLFDFKRGAKLSGSGFPLYTGKGAKLERTLINTMIDFHNQEYGFKEIFPPVLMRKKSMITTGQLPKFEDDMYHTEVDNLYLAPTAEVPVTNIHRNEILEESDLPKYYVAYSPCFRRESGSYGKDTRGLLRVHQFNKVELVKFVKPDSSYDELESLTLQAESILQNLGLHYRVVSLCTGDLSFAAAKCYDIEIWAPGEQKWLEVSSCSNFEAFQARRGNIKYRRNADKKVELLHTLNGSGLATPRLMVALLETYQTENGRIVFPENVAEFLGLKTI
ncbi:MAG: serine--tRNA ligase [Candidatus Marinimicrobia bacterium]|nr:serine--tRNA ligase [Candidatus Neomarinimicrobiota bacterium]|tara:strand:+ start:1892 stop:3157 length:1266 start_codon:yes stop_codon:yes gene_type:complete